MRWALPGRSVMSCLGRWWSIDRAKRLFEFFRRSYFLVIWGPFFAGKEAHSGAYVTSSR